MESTAAEHTSRWGRFCNRLIGVRPGFGDAYRVVEVSRDSEMRAGLNWVIPILATLFVSVLLLAAKTQFQENDGMGPMVFRVFVFDYLIFLFGLVSGWNMARRWRSNADHVEEISLTPLSPAVISTTFSAGAVAIWLKLMLVFCILDMITPFHAVGELFMSEDSLGGPDYPAIVAMVLSSILVPPALAWFHFESARLAHWMFAVHSMPRISLLKAGTANFIVMGLYVMALSAVGSLITFLAVLLLTIAFGIGSFGDYAALETYSGWALGSIAGLMFVAWLKRKLCKMYEAQFLQAWLLYQWWGAGETRQPGTYPMHFYSSLPMWRAFYHAQEEEIAGVPEHKRSHNRQLNTIMKPGMAGSQPGPAHQMTTSSMNPVVASAPPFMQGYTSVQPAVQAGQSQNAVTPGADNTSGSPSQSPDPHSGP